MLLRALALSLLLAPPALADVWSFASPSGNIECWVGQDFDGADLECTIYSRSAPMAQFPACPLHRGISVLMQNRGAVKVECIPETRRPGGTQHVAAYGETGQFGGFTCLSTQRGLDCRNEDGHGFFLSRGVQQAF